MTLSPQFLDGSRKVRRETKGLDGQEGHFDSSSAQAQQHSHPEDPEENEDGTRPQWLEQQERTAADGFVCDVEKLNCQFYPLPEGKNQGQEKDCHDCRDDGKG